MRTVSSLLLLFLALLILPGTASAQGAECEQDAQARANAAYCDCLEDERDGVCAKISRKIYLVTLKKCVSSCARMCSLELRACLAEAEGDAETEAICDLEAEDCRADCFVSNSYTAPEVCCNLIEPSEGCRVNGVLGTCRGTPGPDVILGTDRRDVIDGRGGDDNIHGFGRKDDICGGGGDDVLIGGDGADNLLGEGGDDILEGLRGRDNLDGGPGNDKLDGGAGSDTCFDPNDGNQTYPFESCEN